ncbi:MAG: hypothetical protein ACO3GU_03090 [Pelagibacteraceae bacterium]
MADHGWLEVKTSHAGTEVKPLGIPFEQLGTVGIDRGIAQALPDESPVTRTSELEPEPEPQAEPEPQPDADQIEEPEEPIWKRRPRNWTKAKKEEVVRLWNNHKPRTFHPISVETLNNDRCQAVARLMDGVGGYRRFVEVLPQVLQLWGSDPFWSNPAKGPFSWDTMFGTARDRKQHLMKALDFVSLACQTSKADRLGLRFEPLGDQWIDQRSDLTDSQRIELAVDLVAAGQAPAAALGELPGWTSSHPANERLPQPA